MNKLLLLGLLFLVACTEAPTTSEPVSELPLRVELAPLPSHVLADADLAQQASDDALASIKIAGRVIDNANGWQEAVAMADSELAKNTEIDAGVLSQTLATVLLEHRLLPAPSAEMKREAFRQAESLVRYGSPELELVAQAVEASEDVVPRLKREVVAGVAVSIAREVIHRHDENGVGSAPTPGQPLAVSPAARARAALSRLEAVAGLPD